MKRFGKTACAIRLMPVLLVLGGCTVLAPRPDPSRFFILTPLATAESAQRDADAKGVSLGLGPISLPAYLDRPQMMTRVGPNQVEFSDANRWAEPLEINLARTLAHNLKLLLHADQVVTFPWSSSTKLNYTVPIDVLRFECDGNGNAQLSARWTIKDPKGKRLLETRESQLNQQASSPGAEGSVAALSAVLSDFSREVAAAVDSLRAK